ncbi:MAG: hypothetical protein ACYTAS_21255 [Planctomycetota bacterium]|jgi:hypothetical protein
MKRTKNQIVALMVIVAMGSVQAFAAVFAKGPYLGQTPPGSTPQVFAPGLICDIGPHQGESHATFSADGNTFCFYRNFYVYITENTDQGWTNPKRVKSIPYKVCSPCLSPDANSIYFNQRLYPSRRWSPRRCTRTSKGWSLPQELGPPLTDSGASGGFSVAADNSIYFHSNKIPYGRSPFMVAPFVDNTWAQAITIRLEVGNVRGHSPGIAPDASFMVVYSIQPGAPGGTETDLYLTLRQPNGSWSEPRDMGPKINTRHFEYLSRISPDKKYMFFSRGNGWAENSSRDTSDIYWVALKEYLPESYR